jgi:hypothetical protein
MFSGSTKSPDFQFLGQRMQAIFAHPLEKVKRAVSAVGECGNVYFLHPRTCLQRRLKQGLISMRQALQKSKCGNAA